MNDEMKDLADEANEGNYAAAAELQEATVKVPMSEVPGHAYVAPDHCAETDPMCPKPMAPGSMYCAEHRVTARQHILRKVVSRYFDTVHGKLDGTTAEGSAAQDLRGEQTDAAMRLIDLAGGHMLPYSLVNAAEVGAEALQAQVTIQQKLQMSEVPGHTTTVQHELDAALARIKDLEFAERSRRFVEKSLDRLKPQLARRIAEVICPPLEVSEDEVRGWSQLQIDEWAAIQRAAREAAERLVEKGLRFVPSTEETELAAKHLRFIVAAVESQDFLQTWDGELYERPNDPQIQNELRDSRVVAPGSRPSWTWGVFGLVRVPDETVFGQEADRG